MAQLVLADSSHHIALLKFQNESVACDLSAEPSGRGLAVGRVRDGAARVAGLLEGDVICACGPAGNALELRRGASEMCPLLSPADASLRLFLGSKQSKLRFGAHLKIPEDEFVARYLEFCTPLKLAPLAGGPCKVTGEELYKDTLLARLLLDHPDVVSALRREKGQDKDSQWAPRSADLQSFRKKVAKQGAKSMTKGAATTLLSAAEEQASTLVAKLDQSWGGLDENKQKEWGFLARNNSERAHLDHSRVTDALHDFELRATAFQTPTSFELVKEALAKFQSQLQESGRLARFGNVKGLLVQTDEKQAWEALCDQLKLLRRQHLDLLEQGRFRKAAKLLERARSHVNDARGPLLCRMKKMIEDMGPAELEPEELEPLEAEPESPAADGSTVLEKLKEALAAKKSQYEEANAAFMKVRASYMESRLNAGQKVPYTPVARSPIGARPMISDLVCRRLSPPQPRPPRRSSTRRRPPRRRRRRRSKPRRRA